MFFLKIVVEWASGILVLQELEEQISRQAEDAAVTRALRADIDKVPDLEREVTRLRNENEYWRWVNSVH